MTNDDHRREPPRAGTEAEQLAGALDRLRTTFRWKADDLDAAGLRTAIGASTVTLGALLKHLARVGRRAGGRGSPGPMGARGVLTGLGSGAVSPYRKAL